MVQRPHFEHHRKEALLIKRRFGIANALLVALLVVMGYWGYQSTRASGEGVIQGVKHGAEDTIVSADSTWFTRDNPYSYLLPPGYHLIKIDTPAGWTLNGYTLCYNRIDCHGNAPTPGAEVWVLVSTGEFADLHWHFSITPQPQPQPQPQPLPQPQPQPQPPPPPPPPSTWPPSPRPGSPAPSPTPVAVKDTTPPLVPAGFKAEVGSDGSLVTLRWQTSSDPSGIKGYALDRSTDNAKWTPLSDAITGTEYLDKATDYDTHYYYRLKVTDNAGNGSGFAATDVTTKRFTANISTQSATTIVSEDGFVTAELPAGATPTDTNCSIALDASVTSQLNNSSTKTVLGPYSLVCKAANGDEITSFSSSVPIKIQLSRNQLKTYTNMKVYRFDTASQQWTLATSKFDKKTGQLSLDVDSPQQFVVAGSLKQNYWPLILSILLPLIAIGIGIYIFRLRSAQKSKYDEYIKRKYYNF